jgi:hypothetical protein
MSYDSNPQDRTVIFGRRNITGYLNLREYLAAKALTGLVLKETSPLIAAKKALKYADELIRLIEAEEIR